jgi:phospholipid-binding lipoprotein MlaA
MRIWILVFVLLLNGCYYHCSNNPDDPFESLNRKVFKFNMAFDATVIKPPTHLYIWAIPAPVRSGINGVYNNVASLPTIANDILQLNFPQTQKDLVRLLINTTLGIGGIFDVASAKGYPVHRNDFGLTMAYWGSPRSPYIMIPFLGPATIRDSMGLIVDYTLFSPYPYIPDVYLWPILGVRYLDLRSQLVDSEQLLKNALDQYAFIRDAYLQLRKHQIAEIRPDVNPDQSQDLYVMD